MRLATLFKSVLDFCFPGICSACRGDCEQFLPLRPRCLLQMDGLLTAPSCDRCAAPSAYPDAPCAHCRGEGIKPFDRIVALGMFEEPMRSMIHAIKYHGAWPLAEYLAEFLLERSRIHAMLGEAEVLVALPLHPWRRMSRGYNQAALLSAHLGKRRKIPCAEALMRVRYTETQTHLHSRAKREANLKGAFALQNDRAVRGRRVVLVDDVMTSGATLRAAAQALKTAAPASISAIVLAVADPHGRQFASV